jgi:hypothetical protein
MESEEQRLRVHEMRGLGPNLASMIQFAPPVSGLRRLAAAASPLLAGAKTGLDVSGKQASDLACLLPYTSQGRPMALHRY